MVPSSNPAQLWVITSRRDASTLKEALEESKTLDRSIKVISDGAKIRADFLLPADIDVDIPLCVLPTTCTGNLQDERIVHSSPSQQLSLPRDAPILGYAVRRAEAPEATPTGRATRQDELALAVQDWLQHLPADVRSTLPSQHRISWPTPSYRKHGALLVFGADALSRPPWDSLGTACRAHAPELLRRVCAALGVSHIVANAPIPLTTGSDQQVENVLRAPAGLQLLHGDFPPVEQPGEEAFGRALWSTTKQNGIFQVFAPMYTMFSNGNVTEKKRVLSDDIFVRDLGSGPCSAVDLYAGIGYFAFSYAKAGYETVLCWEINRWSVEGLRRGAEMNGWNAIVTGPRSDAVECAEDLQVNSKIVVFGESNEHAIARIKQLRGQVPPIRHVNCGYLPSSRPSWSSAVRIVDPNTGGWVHAHENCAKENIASRGIEVETFFVNQIKHGTVEGRARSAQCKHIERVKSYAPGVVHCVFDIWISGSES